ncbi:hypothetical protein [Streptomyces sp. NPDC045470]|uniref:hypothetical protein n=1 Tax=Streptomyces sp. NPDC045470 TaxID=3155469 RepID=UPI0033F40042
MSFTSVDAVMQSPRVRNEYWVFSGDQYIRIRVADGDHQDERVVGPRNLTEWNSLKDLQGFSTKVDAVMPVPDSLGQYWVFSGNQYIRMEVGDDPDYIDRRLAGPSSLDAWANTFKDRAPFSQKVDTVTWAPDEDNWYWAFSGTAFLTMTVGHSPNWEDKLEYEPAALEKWNSLKAAAAPFLTKINAVMQTPDSYNNYWFFSGDQYIRINIADRDHTDRLDNGPSPLTDWESFQF